MRRVLPCLFLTTLAVISCGCGGKGGVSTTKTAPPGAKPIIKNATREELVEKYNAMAHGVKSLNATVELKPTAGSKYSGVIEEYHEVKAFLLAKRPAYIRVIGQVPVIGTTVFDMTSDAETFRVYIPSKNKFLVGSVALEHASAKPIENLRPQHLLEAILWPEIQKGEAILFEEFNDEIARYYVLTILRGGYDTEILRKIWFDRSDLQMARLQTFGAKGMLLSDVRVSDWQPVAATPATTNSAAELNAGAVFPRVIRLERPHDDYKLDLLVSKISLNEELGSDRFQLEQPASAELVRIGEKVEEQRSPKAPKP